MGRKSKDKLFEESFGSFIAHKNNDSDIPFGQIRTLTDETIVRKCKHCGGFPRIHEMNFIDKFAHPKNIYVDCAGCGECDGEWYIDVESAIATWNKQNSEPVSIIVPTAE